MKARRLMLAAACIFWIAVLSAATLFVGRCHAKVLIVVNDAKTGVSGAANLQTYRGSVVRETERLTGILDRLGGSYKVVDATTAKTEFVRTGVMVWNYGTAGAYAESFDAVIHLGWGRIGATGAGFYRPDSMLRGGSTKNPTVPQLFLGESGTNGLGSSGFGWADATQCTTGVTTNGSADDNPFVLTLTNGGQIAEGFYAPGYPQVWLSSSYVTGWQRDSAAPAGGVRYHLAKASPNLEIRPRQTGVLCAHCDSLLRAATPDTVVIWERSFNHINGARPAIFAWQVGTAPCFDSTETDGVFATPQNTPCEGETSVMLMALARLDSLTSGHVFENLKPAKWAITIDGGFSRSGRRHYGGVFAPDSNSLIATIDSLNTLDVPAVLGVNTDSLDAYPSERSWWLRWNRLKYAPQGRAGLDSTAVSGNASWSNPRDAWGRWRQRVAYQNDDCQGAADTSVYCLLRAQLYKLRTYFPPDLISRFALPPDDDWSPHLSFNRTAGVDSTLYAASLAGYLGVRINGQWPEAGAYALRSNPVGYFQRQRVYNALGRRMLMLAHSGYPISGSALQSDVRADSTVTYGHILDNAYAPWFAIPAYELNRNWNAGLFDAYWDVDIMQRDYVSATNAGNDRLWHNINRPLVDQLVGVRRGSVIRVSVQSLAGNPNGPATRPMWWTIKSMQHAMIAINRLAGRTLVSFDYPEAIQP